MVKHVVFVLLTCVVAILCFKKPETICKEYEIKCYTNVGKDLFKSAIFGDRKLGIQPLDPIHHRLIEGNLPTVKYTSKDTYGFGLKGLILNEMKFEPPHNIQFDILLPFYEATGNYKIEGRLLTFNIDGNGKLFLNATNFNVKIGTTKKIYEKEGQKYLKLTKPQIKPELLGTMYLHLENLFNGNQALSEPVHKFINENDKIVANVLQAPFALAIVKKLIRNTNKVLAKFPVQELFEFH